MELTDKQVNTPAQEWISRAGKKHLHKVDYDSELKNWLHRAISEVEKNKNFHKKDQLLTLLNDL
jgi:hypothetical protein